MTVSRTNMRHEEPLVKLRGNTRSVFSISPAVNTQAYHDAFLAMPLSKPVAESAYRQAGRILSKANGTQKEYLVAIDARTGELVADNLNEEPKRDGRTGFNEQKKNVVRNTCNGTVFLHNHPSSTRPSLQDVITVSEESAVHASIILAHDSDIWYVAVDSLQIAEMAKAIYNIAQIETGRDAKITALDKLLVLNSAHKLFTWKKVR